MPSTLGEKLRQAREERGISISEVAEQTRISSLYLTAIEKDDYKTLPGGIFNKGFVKSFAKHVGYDEQEALQDYSRLIVESEEKEGDPKTYRPQVLTDDRAGPSIVPTVIFAVIILALMTGGILFVVNYVLNRPSEPTVATNTANTTANANAAGDPVPPLVASSGPSMGNLKVEFTAAGDAVSLGSVNDGKTSEVLIAASETVTFEPKENLKLRYSKSRVQFAQLKINGKPITLPSQPADPKRSTIEFDINKDNLAQIWNSGQIAFTSAEPVAESSPTPAVSALPQDRPRPAAAATPTNAAAPTRPNPTQTPIVVGGRPRSVTTPRPNPN